MKHGIGGYNRACRCEVCVEANRARRRRQMGSEPPSHGLSGYLNYKCRCATCRGAAHAADHKRMPGRYRTLKAQQADRQAETVPGAVHRGEPWVAADIEIAMRDDLTITDLALLLGRTRAAVFYVRNKVRTDPRYARAAGVSRYYAAS